MVVEFDDYGGNTVTSIYDQIDADTVETYSLVDFADIPSGYRGNAVIYSTQPIIVKTDDQALADYFAPILFQASSEVYYPVTIQYTLDNSELVANYEISIKSPKLTDLLTHPTGSLNLAGTKPSETQEHWVNDLERDSIIYARITHDGDITAIQYWFHYYYSSWGLTKGCDQPRVCLPWEGGGNNHEGDWEMIQIMLQQGDPRQAVFAQHNTRSKRLWEHVEKQGERPVAYVSWGSHASYFKNAYYYHLFFAENTSVNASPPAEIEMLTSDSQPPWLEFRGNWGIDSGSGGNPRWLNSNSERPQWNDPFAWWREAAWD